MFSLKRSVIAVLVLALALTGVITASANTDTEDRVLRQQAEETAWLGISITDTDDGVLINQVESGSPADEAGLRHGDIITAADATVIDSAAVLVETIQSHVPGDEIAVTFKRGDEADTIVVTLAARPIETATQPYRLGPSTQPMIGMLNLFGLNLEVTDEGLIVQAIDPDSPFGDSGLESGDLITAIDGESITGELMPPAIFGHMRFDEPIVFSVVRDGEEMEIEVALDIETIMPMMPEVFPPNSNLQIQPVPASRPTQLGVQFLTLNAEVAEEEGLDGDQGALIVEVFEDTPAAAAGLQAGDVILAVDGDVVDEERTLADRLYAYEEGDVVTLMVLREGEEIGIEVELGPSNHDVMFDGSIQIMPMQPPVQNPGQRPGGRGRSGQQGFFGFDFGQNMPMHPDMNFFFFGGQPGELFELHPFMDGGMFEFHFGDVNPFGDHHPFWGPDGDADSGEDSSESMEAAPDTNDNDTPM